MRKLPPLAELRAFEAAARHSSFKLAAEELAVTPTAISHQIKLLEHYCGCSFFRRRPRPVKLTEAGAALYPVIRDGLDAFANAVSSIKWQNKRQVLTVTTTNAFASKWLVPRLSRWRTAHPRVALEVIGTDAILDLRKGEADIAVRYMKAAPTDFAAHELIRDTFVAVCRPDLLPGGKPLRALTDLTRYTLIHAYWPPSDPTAPTWQRWLDAASAQYHDVPKLQQMEHLSFREELHAIDAAANGQGILIVSDLLVVQELAHRTLMKALKFSLPGYGFYLTHRPDHPRLKTINAFVEWARRETARRGRSPLQDHAMPTRTK